MSYIIKVCGYLFACVLMLAGIVILLDAMGLTEIFYLAANFVGQAGNPLLVIFIGALVFLTGFALFLGGLFIRPQKVAKVPGGDGKNDIYVTFGTIQDMIKRTAFATPGIVGVHTRIGNGRSGLKLVLRVKVNYEDKITTVGRTLQDTVKSVVETSTSLPVKSIRVLVAKADTDRPVEPGSVSIGSREPDKGKDEEMK